MVLFNPSFIYGISTTKCCRNSSFVCQYVTSWWFQPISKIWSAKWESSLNRGKNSKNLWNHHLVTPFSWNLIWKPPTPGVQNLNWLALLNLGHLVRVIQDGFQANHSHLERSKTCGNPVKEGTPFAKNPKGRRFFFKKSMTFDFLGWKSVSFWVDDFPNFPRWDILIPWKVYPIPSPPVKMGPPCHRPPLLQLPVLPSSPHNEPVPSVTYNITSLRRKKWRQ